MSEPPHALARRYAAWIDRHRRAVLIVALALAVAGGVLASQLPLRTDLSNLLPPSAESVRHLRALEKRAQAFGTAFVVIEADDPALRRGAAERMRDRLEAMPPQLVGTVVFDDSAVREYFWTNRFLFASLEDLQEARDALADTLREARLDANPLYVDFDDEPSEVDERELEERVASLRDRFDEAEREAERPAGFVSDDERYQLIIIRTAFSSSNFARGERMVSLIERHAAELRAELGDGVDVGITGNVVLSLDEHRAVLRGMRLAAAITIALCALALLLYYRSVLPVMASLGSLAVGTLVTFGFARVAIGHLNLVTTFLAAIVVGNGVNAGLILLARYFEEVRAGREGVDLLAATLAGAAPGTLAASLTAGSAYASLVVTDFRGFRHFGIIGGVGMVLCWLAAFSVLPAALAVLERRGSIKKTRRPTVGRVLARLLPRRLGAVAIAGGLVTLVAAAATWRYVASGPLQEDWSDMRPSGSTTSESVRWDRVVADSFDSRFRQGLTQRFVVGVERRDQVAPLVAALRAADRDRDDADKLLHGVQSLDDVLPDHQPEKLALLAEINELLDDELMQELDEEDLALIDRIRPPATIATMTDRDVPEALAWPFTERDGTRGRLLLATSNLRFKTWNIRHRMEFASRFRKVDLPDGAVVGGQSFIFADMVGAMGRDGPLATIVALLGAIAAVWLIVGLGRHGLVTLACAASGILGMIALVSLAGLKVNVIDFIALPITIGLGIDYAVNIAARERQPDAHDPRQLLATTGGAVLLCSYTTIVGYGSLLLSDSGGIRSFGLAAILGEVSCVVAALVLGPTLLALLRRTAARRRQESAA